MSVPTWMHGLPPAVIRMKGRIERERERAEAKRLSGALEALVENQRRLARIVDVAEHGDQTGALQ